MYSDAFNPPRALVRIMPHTPALGCTRQIDIQERGLFRDSQYPKTEATGNSYLFLLFHIEIPNNEPWENREGEVCGDKPCCDKPGLVFMYIRIVGLVMSFQ
jgi:hypothetical protein